MNISTTLKITITLIPIIFLQYGCASVGKDFKYENTPGLEIGITRNTEYRQMFGEPNSVELKTTSDGRYELVRYLYAYADMGTSRSRLLDLEFKNDILNAYNYLSSFDDGKTYVDTSGLDNIKRGSSNKTDVTKHLGKPYGIARCPSQNYDFKSRCINGADEVWTWMGSEKLATFGSKNSSTKNIFVSFDKSGIVTEIESSQTN